MSERKPKRITKTYRKDKQIAEWMVVHEGKTLDEVCASPEITASPQTVQQWSIKFNWQEQRKRYELKPISIPKMSYDLVYSELLKLNRKQMNGTIVTKLDVDKLEKLVKIYKQTGLPFAEQVANVMKVFLHFIGTHTIKDSEEKIMCVSLVRDFIDGVDSGFIHLDDQL